MNFILIWGTLCCIHFAYSVDPIPADDKKKKALLEDMRVVNETITKYGLPQDYKQLGLPGPELLADRNKLLHKNEFIGEPGNYTLRVRAVVYSFSYNSRFEESRPETIDEEEVQVTKGQFGEHFERESGGYYIRTIGYTLDQNGYRQFLLDISTASINLKHRISSTAIASLVGGGIG